MAYAADDNLRDLFGSPMKLKLLRDQYARALRAIGQGAVQLHGAMGVTEELYVARCFRRATQIELLFGQTGQHLRRMDQLLFNA